MHYLPLIILVLLVSLLSILLDRWQARKVAAAEQASAAAESTDAAPGGVFNRLTNQVAQRFGRKPPVLDDPVREWLTAAFRENAAERAWFASLTPEQFKLLRKELTAFCAELGFDLDWLAEKTPFKPATLEQTGKTIVTHYCRAVRAAVLVQDEVKALQRYQTFLANPTSKENLIFGQQLFASLVDQKLAPPATPELLMADEKERQNFVIQSIQEAVIRDEVAFGAVLKAVVFGVPQLSANAVTTVPTTLNGATAASRVAV